MWVVKKCFKLLSLKQTFDKCPEQNVIRLLRSWNWALKQDEYGNLYLINPGTPLICAHMDTVQRQDSVDKIHTLRLVNGIIKADNAIIGWDDKCWIAIAMEMYEKLGNKISLLFTRQEETWCNWARHFCNYHNDLLSQCKYCLVLDRRNDWDIIGYSNQYCSKAFEDEIYRLTKEFGYKPCPWLSSDTGCIAKYINGVNLSVWYYNPHSKEEFVNCDHLTNAYEAAMYIVQHLTDDFPIYSLPVKEYKYPLSDDDDDYDTLWVNSREAKNRERWYRNRKTNYNYKQENLFSDDKKSTKKDKALDWLGKYFYVTKNWTVRVKKDIFLCDLTDDSKRAELPAWEYEVIEYS